MTDLKDYPTSYLRQRKALGEFIIGLILSELMEEEGSEAALENYKGQLQRIVDELEVRESNSKPERVVVKAKTARMGARNG